MLKQIARLLLFNLRNLPQRMSYSLIAMTGIAFVCLLLIGVSALTQAFQQTFARMDAYNNLLILKSGSTSELNSHLSADTVAIVEQLVQQLPGGDQVALSAEVYLVASLPNRDKEGEGNVPLRGVTPAGGSLRAGFRLLEGRWYRPGVQEFLVGRAAQQMYQGLDLGSRVQIGQQSWLVVGVFDADHGIATSELWASPGVLQSSFNRFNNYQLIYSNLRDEALIGKLRRQIAEHPAIDLKLITERDYYAGQIEHVILFVNLFGYFSVIIVSLIALFVAGNSMYDSVATRFREIALYRALGFDAKAVVAALLAESMLLAAGGAFVAWLLALLILDGNTISFLNIAGTFSQQQLSLELNTALAAESILWALLLGLLAGVIPAVASARKNIAMNLKDNR